VLEPYHAVVVFASEVHRSLVLLACESAGFEPHVDHSSDDFRAIVALVAAGGGVALVPRSALHGAMLAGASPN
jgi:DNA-binding transcriptional LysR family regulator